MIPQTDEATHDDIMRLDLKLKGLLAEIEAKKAALTREGMEGSEERMQQLNLLSSEIKKALGSLSNLVSLMVKEESHGDNL